MWMMEDILSRNRRRACWAAASVGVFDVPEAPMLRWHFVTGSWLLSAGSMELERGRFRGWMGLKQLMSISVS